MTTTERIRRETVYKPGDWVQYHAQFLRSVGIFTGNIPFLKGFVVEGGDDPKYQVVRVQWDDGTIGVILGYNLARLGSTQD